MLQTQPSRLERIASRQRRAAFHDLVVWALVGGGILVTLLAG